MYSCKVVCIGPMHEISTVPLVQCVCRDELLNAAIAAIAAFSNSSLHINEEIKKLVGQERCAVPL